MIQLHSERTPNVLRTVQTNSNYTLTTRFEYGVRPTYMVGRVVVVST
jgi:hypothetical protein